MVFVLLCAMRIAFLFLRNLFYSVSIVFVDRPDSFWYIRFVNHSRRWICQNHSTLHGPWPGQLCVIPNLPVSLQHIQGLSRTFMDLSLKIKDIKG